MPSLTHNRLAVLGSAATCAIAAGILLTSDRGGLAVARSGSAPIISFSNLSDAGSDGLPPAARAALDHAGAPKSAPTTASVRGDYTVAVVRGPDTYLALVHNATQRATIVQAPPAELANQAGTWVSAGGSSDGGITTLAMLLPDGVESVEVTDTRGAKSRAAVTDNVAVIQRQGRSTAEYQFDGTSRLVELPSPPTP